MMRRRDFMTGLGATAAAFALPCHLPEMFIKAAKIPAPAPLRVVVETDEEHALRCDTEQARDKAFCLVEPRTLTFADLRYEPTSEDALTLLRAVEGEVSPGATDAQKQLDAMRVAETLTNRFCYLRGRAREQISLATFVRAYAQPLSARWADVDGHACQAHPERCTEAQMARRLEHRARTCFETHTVSAARLALRKGHQTTPWASIHFAKSGIRMSPEMIRITQDVEKMNTLFATPDSMLHWNGYRVV